MARIKTDFSTFSNNALLNEASRIIASMTGNAFFPAAVPPLFDVKEAYDAFYNAVAVPGEGNKDATIVKNKTRHRLERL